MRVNYFGCLNTVKAAYDDMVSRNSGHIVLVASVMALLGESSSGGAHGGHGGPRKRERGRKGV
jgi:NADP-dependent 3-hydroxy acid dehydrogenase YdfG